MRAIRGILIAIVAISLLSTPITAQTPQPAPTTTAAPAKEPLRTVAWNKIAGNWKRFKGSIKQRWGKLTKNEITQAQGRREALNGFIQARYGIDREAADRQIDEWLKTLK